MDKLLIAQVSRLLSLCLILICGAAMLTSFLLIKSQQQEEAPEALVCGVIDYAGNQYDDLTQMDSTQITGKQIFEQNCAACHNRNDEALVGPGLQGVTERQTVKWIVRWVQNSQKILQQGDKYAVNLYEKFNKTQMTAFPNLSESEIRAILSYIERKPFAVALLGGVRATGSNPHGQATAQRR